jgi:ABC-2 type transport system permease protein
MMTTLMREIRAELLKVTTTKMVLWLSLALAAYTAMNVAALIFFSGQQGIPPLTEPIILRSVFAAAGSASVIVLVLGILGMTTEYRHQTITSTFLVTPRRGIVLLGKIKAFALVGIGQGLIALIVGFGLALVLLPLKDHAPIPTSSLWEIGGAVLLAFCVYGIVGVCVGALIRNQIAAIIVALVWMVLVEPLVVAFLPAVGKWLPGGAVNAILGASSFTGGQASAATSLPAWGGTLLLLGYAVAFGAVAAATTLRRDIT